MVGYQFFILNLSPEKDSAKDDVRYLLNDSIFQDKLFCIKIK